MRAHRLCDCRSRGEVQVDTVTERPQDAGDVRRYLVGYVGEVAQAPDVDPFAAGPRLADQAPRPRQVGGGPGPIRARVQRVGAVALVAGQAWRDRLAGGGREAGPAVQLDDG